MNFNVDETCISLITFQAALRRIGEDRSINTTHVSLLTSIFICWQESGFKIPFMVSRRVLMAYSKIGSKTTYHKCLGELLERGYIGYKPSFHPRLASLIWWQHIDSSKITPSEA